MNWNGNDKYDLRQQQTIMIQHNSCREDDSVIYLTFDSTFRRNVYYLSCDSVRVRPVDHMILFILNIH